MKRIGGTLLVGSAIVFSTFTLAASGLAQNAHVGGPPLNGSHELRVTDHDLPSPPRRIDLDRAQKDADDLARAANSIPGAIEQVRKGMLPKDMMQTLKQIEKLSKQLRNELNP